MYVLSNWITQLCCWIFIINHWVITVSDRIQYNAKFRATYLWFSIKKKIISIKRLIFRAKIISISSSSIVRFYHGFQLAGKWIYGVANDIEIITLSNATWSSLAYPSSSAKCLVMSAFYTLVIGFESKQIFRCIWYLFIFFFVII